MRIQQLDLIKYGKFDSESLAFPKAAHDFHVVVGPNEAGKSTVRNAVLELLFGMPARTPLAFLHELTELRLGGILGSQEGEVVFHRARGRTQLRTPNDERLPDDYLLPLLGSATKEFFEQMFCLDHERLVEGGRSILDASKDLGRVLFQSAAGIGGLGPVREALENRVGELWTRRGASSEYAQAEARFIEAGADFKAAHVRTKVWSEAKDTLDGINEEIAEARAEHLRLEFLRSKLERVRRLAPFLRELAAKEAELSELGDVTELPSTAYVDLTSGQSGLAGSNRVLEERRKDLDARQCERGEITTDDEILALSKDIELLDEARGACANHQRDLPLRRAEVGRLLEAAFAAASQLGWPTDEETLRGSLPGALSLKTVTNLLREHGALHQAMVGAEEAVEERKHDLQMLQEQFEGLVASEVPGELRLALTEAQTLDRTRSRRQSLKADIEEADRQFADALAALGRWRPSLEALRTMDVPSIARISALQREEQDRMGAVRNARGKLDESQALMERLRLEEKHFTESHKVVTHAEVLDARGQRDNSWNDVKSGAVTIEAGAQAVDVAIRLADELVDLQLGSATEAAKLQGLREQEEVARADVSRKREILEDRKAELAQFQTEWAALTMGIGLDAIALDDLPQWLIKREAVFAAEVTLRQCRRDLDGEESAYGGGVEALAKALGAVLVTVIDATDMAALLSAASAFVQSADSARTRKESLDQQIAQGERTFKTLKAKAEKAAEVYRAWEDQWRAALQAAKLSEASATLAQAEGAVELANTVAEKLDAAEGIRRNRIQTMQADLDALEAETCRLSRLLDKDLVKLPDWSEVARRLMTRLRAANSAAQAAMLADEALKEAKTRKENAELDVVTAEERIQPLLKLAGVKTVEEALPLVDRSDRRRALLEAIDKATSMLFREGDGLTREAIEAEVAEQDPAAVIGILEGAKRDLSRLTEQLNVLAQRQVTAQQTFSAINGQANAAIAEAKRQEALAAMGDASEQYLEIATASRLLKWAIDRYRDQKQGPMLQRAGEVFAQLTLDQFTKLVVDHEASPLVLYAKRTRGKQVEVSGLSEGTRDQLFLALRVAALELHLQHAKALPFIADDLFVNFDDERAKAGLEALRELSGRTQVIFLTHHEHLRPLVQEVFSSTVNVVELRRNDVTA
ncbi:AAA family ATPase [Paraburkholderia madseniana]|uniref:AAA family ATPase n=1 Tax=Paraburkholderia madseniana TaxID=2599607 RepID=A0A6N6W5Z6_9BURK|nr:YhaN family protein [Paraburkholderia madseniana]KAE8755631.1 AAA family ATPase [Paraburkholderia madseniana]